MQGEVREGDLAVAATKKGQEVKQLEQEGTKDEEHSTLISGQFDTITDDCCSSRA